MKELLTIPGTELVQHMLFETNSVAVMLALMSGRWRRNNRVMSLLPSGIDATHHDQGERQRYGSEQLCSRHSC